MSSETLQANARAFFETGFNHLNERGYSTLKTAEPKVWGFTAQPRTQVIACRGNTLEGALHHPGGSCVFKATKRDGTDACQEDLEEVGKVIKA